MVKKLNYIERYESKITTFDYFAVDIDDENIILNNEKYMLALFSMIAVVLLFVALKMKSEIMMNFIMRGILGTLGIYCINQVLVWEKISCQVGINVYSVLTSATLGFPGVVMLYGIRALSFL